MRITYPSLDFVKTCAKRVSTETGKSLSRCQQGIANASGYSDWHELEHIDFSVIEKSDVRHLSVSNEATFICSLAAKLGASVGDVQFAFSRISRLGVSCNTQERELALRAAVYRLTDIPDLGRRRPGAVGKLKGTKEQYILKRYERGGGAYCVSNHSIDSMMADFEFVQPRIPLALFIPMRLYVPYGIWVEADGSKVIFSRDYLPMWRVRPDKTAERLSPMLWIKWVDQYWFWEDANTPWDRPASFTLAMSELTNFGIKGLPKLADILSILILENDHSTKSAAERLFGKRQYDEAA